MELGVKRGKAMGVLLGDMEAWWVENDFRPGRGACLTKLEELVRKSGLV